MWQMFTHTHHGTLYAYVCKTAGRGRVFPQHVTFKTLVSSGVHTRIHAPATGATVAAMTAAANNHTASHVARERTTKVIPQIQCAPCHARSLSVHGIFGSPPPPRGDLNDYAPRARPAIHPAQNAHPPSMTVPPLVRHRSTHKHGVHGGLVGGYYR